MLEQNLMQGGDWVFSIIVIIIKKEKNFLKLQTADLYLNSQ